MLTFRSPTATPSRSVFTRRPDRSSLSHPLPFPSTSTRLPFACTCLQPVAPSDTERQYILSTSASICAQSLSALSFGADADARNGVGRKRDLQSRRSSTFRRAVLACARRSVTDQFDHELGSEKKFFHFATDDATRGSWPRRDWRFHSFSLINPNLGQHEGSCFSDNGCHRNPRVAWARPASAKT